MKGAQSLFVTRHHFGNDAFVVVFGLCQRHLGVQTLVFPRADGPLPLPRGGNINRAADVFQYAGDVVGVQDRKLRLQTQRNAILPQHAYTQRVKCAYHHLFGGFANQLLGTFAHFGGGFVGESNGGNVFGRNAALNQAPNFVRDHACFARASPRQHQARPMHVIHCLLLGNVQSRTCHLYGHQ